MVGEGRGLNRRQAAAGLAVLPIAACQPSPQTASKQPMAGPEIKPAYDNPNALLELSALNPDIRLDIRYATPNNVTGVKLYDQARAFLVVAAAKALVRAQVAAKADGFGLLIQDAYRPWSVTKKLWDATSPAKRGFVADPKQGSRHNRGCAVDLTLYDRNTGQAIEMPSAYDEFSARAYRSYSGGSVQAINNRDRLERYMQDSDFVGISNEWWHFDYQDWANYPIMDVAFSDI